VTQSLVSRA